MQDEYKITDIKRIVVESLLPKMLVDEKCCTCERCRLDVEALTLNFLPSKYVVSEQGDMLETYRMNTAQSRMEIYTAMFRAISIVKSNPHHPLPEEAE